MAWIENRGIRSAAVECCIRIDLAAHFGSGQKAAAIAADGYRCSVVGSQKEFVGSAVVKGRNTSRGSIDLANQRLQRVVACIHIDGNSVDLERAIGYAGKLREIRKHVLVVG